MEKSVHELYLAEVMLTRLKWFKCWTTITTAAVLTLATMMLSGKSNFLSSFIMGVVGALTYLLARGEERGIQQAYAASLTSLMAKQPTSNATDEESE